MTRILIADDHAIVRRGLKQILEEEPGLEVQGEAQNAQEVLEYLRKQKWDLVILDISMPGRSGLDVLCDLRMDYPSLPVLILSMHPEDQYALRVLKAGASGYLNKQSAPEELIHAVRKILSGGRYISETLADKLATGFDGQAEQAAHEKLSDREYQVLLLIASGKTISEIAGMLSLSIKTVSTYRSRNTLECSRNSRFTSFFSTSLEGAPHKSRAAWLTSRIPICATSSVICSGCSIK